MLVTFLPLPQAGQDIRRSDQVAAERPGLLKSCNAGLGDADDVAVASRVLDDSHGREVEQFRQIAHRRRRPLDLISRHTAQ